MSHKPDKDQRIVCPSCGKANRPYSWNLATYLALDVQVDPLTCKPDVKLACPNCKEIHTKKFIRWFRKTRKVIPFPKSYQYWYAPGKPDESKIAGIIAHSPSREIYDRISAELQRIKPSILQSEEYQRSTQEAINEEDEDE